MKKVTIAGGVFAAIVVSVFMLAMTGCSAANDDIQADNRSGSACTAVVFSVSEGANSGTTRTAQGTMTVDGAASTESLQAHGFGVFACHTGVHPYVSTSTKPDLLYNQLVTYDQDKHTWSYAPMVYWPNGDDGAAEHVTFFAYGPHSDHANGCIADMSRSDELGDPWILYQLGGTSVADGEDGWKANQVDLVYDFQKDKVRSVTPSTQVNFDFKHALACIGDRIIVSCDESVTNRLMDVYTDSPVAFTVTELTIDYLLTRKGRLVLNNATQPNWQAVASEDAKVHRTLTFTPNLVMARATSGVAYTTTPFDSGAGHGIFYIPIESGSSKQQVSITAQYTITAGNPVEVVEENSVTTVIDLSFISNASEGRNMNITLRVPES